MVLLLLLVLPALNVNAQAESVIDRAEREANEVIEAGGGGPVDVIGELTNAATKGGVPITDQPEIVVGRLVKGFLGVLGMVALILVIYGGFLIMTGSKGGKEGDINKGKDVLKWAIIGLIIIFSSYAIADFVVDRALRAVGA